MTRSNEVYSNIFFMEKGNIQLNIGPKAEYREQKTTTSTKKLQIPFMPFTSG